MQSLRPVRWFRITFAAGDKFSPRVKSLVAVGVVLSNHVWDSPACIVGTAETGSLPSVRVLLRL